MLAAGAASTGTAGAPVLLLTPPRHTKTAKACHAV
jgi:hypothetical protein